MDVGLEKLSPSFGLSVMWCQLGGE